MEKTWYETLFALSPDLIGSADMNGYFIELNPSWERVLGFSREELCAVPYLDFIHPDDKQSTLDAASSLAEGAAVIHFENRYRCKDGTYRWLSWSSVPLQAEGRVYFVVRDITRDKEIAEELRQSKQELKRYAAELEENNRRLQQEIAERTQSEAAMLHQQEVMRAMSTPIIRVWRGVLALPVIGLIDEERAAQMMEALLRQILEARARFAILDLTGVEQVDAGTAARLSSIVRAARLLGSSCVLSGISPQIARIMAENETETGLFRSFAGLEDALRYALGEMEQGRRQS